MRPRCRNVSSHRPGADCKRREAAVNEKRLWRWLGASRQAAPARGSCCGGRRFATTALRCSPRGRAAKLTARADPETVLLVAAQIAAGYRPARGRGWGCSRPNTTSAAAKAAQGRSRCAYEHPRPLAAPDVRGETALRYKVNGSADMTEYALVRASQR
jgi:hypothetical protein